MKKTLLALMITSGFAMPAANATTNIDVLGVYTKATSEWFNQDHMAQIQHRFNVGNQILKESGLDIKVNLIAAREYDFDSAPGYKKSQGQALDAITPGQKQDRIFGDIETVRKDVGADMVAMFRNLDLNNTPDYDAQQGLISCGLAWVVAANDWQYSPSNAKRLMYSHSYINECGADTFIHELGHNFGLNHAHEQYQGAPDYGYPHTNNGTEKDAYGYGVQNSFATTMAYGFLFGVNGRSYTFSNPDKTCQGQACGKKDYANAVRAINLTAPKIANIYNGNANGDTGTTTPDGATGQNVYTMSSPLAIPDANQIVVPFDVSYNGDINQTTIELDIDHQYIGDISVELYSPGNSRWVLKQANSNDRGTQYKVRFTLQGVDPAEVTGQWRLVVADNYSRDTGILNSATLSFN
ncbi:zinc-dependent metalloprotease family protein [Vibrio proteolyticus]